MIKFLRKKKIIIFLILLVIFSFKAKAKDEVLSITLTGDSIITRKLSVYKEPNFLKMIEIIRSSDVAFTNLETLFHDYETYPMHKSGGTYMRSEPELAKELKWAGFDMVSRANNHAGDYGVLAMNLTSKYVREAGLVEAGVGNSLPEAREAKFIETSKARIALISCSSTFPDHIRAGKTRGDIPPRPGINPLRFTIKYLIPEKEFNILKKIKKQLISLEYEREGEKENELNFFGNKFIKAEKFDIITEPNPEDIKEISAVVKNASRLADYVIVSFHSHESYKKREIPAKFIVSFAHVMIDSGADICVGHGPHVLRGIEIYKGKPIFYSLGNFIFQNETLLRLPYENYERYKLGPEHHVADFNDARYKNDTRGFPSKPDYWESVIAVTEWKGEKLYKIKLYPITLGFGKPRTVRGRPFLTDKKLSEKIIERLKKLSAEFGTKIQFQNGIGLIKSD